MRAIDTNVIVRLAERDDEDQFQTAFALLDDRFIILPTVLMEAVWVLKSSCGMARAEIAEKLSELMGHENAVPVSGGAIQWALSRFADRGDFADLLHLALAKDANATSFASFDKALANATDPAVEVERLT